MAVLLCYVCQIYFILYFFHEGHQQSRLLIQFDRFDLLIPSFIFSTHFILVRVEVKPESSSIGCEAGIQPLWVYSTVHHSALCTHTFTHTRSQPLATCPIHLVVCFGQWKGEPRGNPCRSSTWSPNFRTEQGTLEL